MDLLPLVLRVNNERQWRPSRVAFLDGALRKWRDVVKQTGITIE
jgi:hypothetical protein